MDKTNCQSCAGTGLTGIRMDQDCRDCNGTGLVLAVPPTPAKAIVWPDNEAGVAAQRLCSYEDLSDWEGKFAESIAVQAFEGKQLSALQWNKINEIINRRSFVQTRET